MSSMDELQLLLASLDPHKALTGTSYDGSWDERLGFTPQQIPPGYTLQSLAPTDLR
jgi:hypothetical protein